MSEDKRNVTENKQMCNMTENKKLGSTGISLCLYHCALSEI